MKFTQILGAIAQLASLGTTLAGEDFFVMSQCATLTVARIDPIVNPGKVAKHVHNVCGGSGFGPDLSSPNDQVGASCSSAEIGDDKSNYWAPQLYWQFPNGTYQPMIGRQRIYYFMKGDEVKPFPPGLHMVTGDPNRDPSSKKAFGVKISCNGGDRIGELPQGKKCSGISLGIFFPSCGLADGSISSDDHFSHMAWPLKQLGGGSLPFDDVNYHKCPPSHPIKYPTIFYETNYYPTGGQVWEEGTKYVLSNGDEWGPSYHADFHAGWDQSTLENTIKQCGGYGKGPGDNLQACAPLAPSISKEKSRECRYEGKIPNEDVGFARPISSLPGCNPAWPKGVDTKPGCSNPPAEPEFVYPNVYFADLVERSHIPIVFTGMNSTVDAETLKQNFAPSIGDHTQSFLVPWGTDGSNQDKLRVSTVQDLLLGGGGDQNTGPIDDTPEAVPSAASSAASSSASPSAQASSASASASADASSQAPTSQSASPSISMPGAVISAASSAASSALAAPSASSADSAPSASDAASSTAAPSFAAPSASSAGAAPAAFDPAVSNPASSHAAPPVSTGVEVEAGAAESATSAAATMPTAGHAASPGGKTCRKGHRVHHTRSAGHVGRRSRRAAFRL